MKQFKEILLEYWAYTHFRPLQEDIIASVFSGRDTLGLMPTGGGKSITFQVPAMAMDGICIVITPLIALMRDQVENLKKRNIKTIAIHSGMSKEEIDFSLDNCVYGDIKFLYVSPERLATEIFKSRVKKMKVCMITVDEAHCISQWGYDFRPSYMRIAELRDVLPDIPVLALTATATADVIEDIMVRLKFREKNVFRKSFERKNLIYRVEKVEDKLKRVMKIIENLPGSGIIYVRNRRNTAEVAMLLKKMDISVDFYHAGLSHEMRNQKQSDWQKGKTRIIVSTNAFGMGIDKSDVRFVIHLDLPDSLEAYFQEAGRAGRDEKEAYAVVLYNNSDLRNAEQRIATNFPEIQVLKEVYHALGNFLQVPIAAGKNQSYDFNFSDFLTRYKYSVLIAHSAFKILEREGYIEITDEINNPSRIHFEVQRDDLYKFQVANEHFDGFIKLLLRSYTGLFSSYVAIDETLLAKRSGLKAHDIYAYLNRLKTLGIINYIPKKKNPVLIYTEERLDNTQLRFSPENYKFLKERFIEKLNHVIHYTTSNTICRSLILLNYFSEKNAVRCGNCDVCRRQEELELTDNEFSKIRDSLRKHLKEKNADIRELIDSIPSSEEKTLKVFRWLLDHGNIVQDENMLYFWRD
jgi:ATP-dependent DNA helicase RecQ